MREIGNEDDYLPGAASLIDQIDSRLLLVLRDGRNLIGTLRSFDQYMNLVLEETIERVTHGDKYSDIPLGLFVLRGDNIILFGEIDLEKDRNCNMQQLPMDEFTLLLENEKSKTNINWDLE